MIAELAEVFDLLGVAVLVLGTLVTCGRAIHVGRVAGCKPSYRVARRTFGKALLLGLEVLIAADLMRSVSLNLTISCVMALGLLVVVRTILSSLSRSKWRVIWHGGLADQEQDHHDHRHRYPAALDRRG